MRDRDSKGRTGWAEKERNGNHSLTEEDVISIRELYSSGKYLQRELGDMFEVEQTTVSTIVRNKTWKGVNERGN
jgi:DNA-binding MarR family transcriptional regulator